MAQSFAYTQVAPINSHEDLDGTIKAVVHVGDLLLSMWIRRAKPVPSSRRQLYCSLAQPMLMQDVAEDICG